MSSEAAIIKNLKDFIAWNIDNISSLENMKLTEIRGGEKFDVTEKYRARLIEKNRECEKEITRLRSGA